MSIKFFSGEERVRRLSRSQPPARETQQALLLRLLREANGATVSYDRLRDAGIELPASVVSELELAGFPIERRYEGAGGSPRRPGVSLNPALDPEPPPSEAVTAKIRRSAKPNAASRRPTSIPAGLPQRLTAPFARGLTGLSEKRWKVPTGVRVRVPSHRRWSELRPSARVLAPLAVIGAVIVVIAVVVIALQSPRVNSHHVARHRVSKPQSRSTRVVERTPQPSPPQQPAPTVSPALATQFEAQGHDLLESGQYGTAVPMLRRAIAATGEQLGDCLEPVSDTCLTYAYALYDLGRALELNGDPGAALPVLKQRFQIDNQRDVVAAELARVRTSVQQ